MSPSEPSLEAQRINIERERLEWEKAKEEATSPLSKYLGAIVVVLAAIVSGVFSLTQVHTTKIIKEKEIEIARLQNEAEMDRRWRGAMLEFLERHEKRLFSQKETESSQALTLLELSFPSQYVQPVRSKLVVLVATTAPDSEERIVGDLLKPLIEQLDRTKAAVDGFNMGDLDARDTIIEGNRTALNLLVSKTSLIPKHLREDAARLVEHYESWLRWNLRDQTQQQWQQVSEPFIPFPANSALRFRDELKRRTD